MVRISTGYMGGGGALSRSLGLSVPPCDRNRSENDPNRIDALMRAHGGLGSLVRPPASCLEWCGA